MKKFVLIIISTILISTVFTSCSTAKKVKELKFDISNLDMEIGSYDKLTLLFNPVDAEKPEIVWSSSDEKVASVDSTGTVNALSIGSATITAKTKDGKLSTSSNVTVKSKSVKGVKLNKDSITIEVGVTDKLEVTIDPSDAGNKKVTWESNNAKVASVDENGIVKGISAGTADITVKTEDGGFTAKCIATIKAKPQPKQESKSSTSTPGTSSTNASGVYKYEARKGFLSIIISNNEQMNFQPRINFNPQPTMFMIQLRMMHLVNGKLLPPTSNTPADFKAVFHTTAGDAVVKGKTDYKDVSIPVPREASLESRTLIPVDIYITFMGKEYKFYDELYIP